MSALSEAKKELNFNHEFVQLIEVLKEIAASQFQAHLRKKERFERFLTSFGGFFKMVDLVTKEHPLVCNASETTGLVMVTSDEGFMGGLNAMVIQTALNQVEGKRRRLVVVGSRGADYLKDAREEYVSFPGIISENRYEQAVKLKDFLVESVLKGEFGAVLLVYPRPISFTVLKPEVVFLLPCAQLFQKGGEELLSSKQKVLVESPISSIVEYLVEMWLIYKLCEIFEDSKLAELAARTQRLEQSYDTLSQKEVVLKHRYFRSRHEFVDKGMRETFASALLRRKTSG